MPVCSPERLLDNQRNAQKSTGSRTPEGKARSRANAWTHGLTGDGIALPDEEAAVVAARFDSLRDQFDPRTPLGGILCKRVAMLSVRMDRSYEAETASLFIRVLAAESSFVDARKAEAEHLLHWLAAEPATNSRRLMASPEGVDLVIAEWEQMKLDINHQDGGTRWSHTHWQLADNLHGHRSSRVGESEYAAWSMALKRNYELIRPDRLAGMADAERKCYALDRLADLVDAELISLRDHRATMETRGGDAQRAFAAKMARFDPSKDAVLDRKYEAATERGLYRALHEMLDVEATGHSEDVTPDQVRESEEVGSFIPATSPEPDAPEEADEPDETPVPQISQAPASAEKVARDRTIRVSERIVVDKGSPIIANS